MTILLPDPRVSAIPTRDDESLVALDPPSGPAGAGPAAPYQSVPDPAVVLDAGVA